MTGYGINCRCFCELLLENGNTLYTWLIETQVVGARRVFSYIPEQLVAAGQAMCSFCFQQLALLVV